MQLLSRKLKPSNTKLEALLPGIKVERTDERFTSLIANPESMLESGQ
jgi:hypothetical protein